MSGDVNLQLWLHEYKFKALSAVLEKQGSTVGQRMQERLLDLYAELVPQDIQEEIRSRINAEQAAWAAEEAARQYTAFRVRENGADRFFQLGQREGFPDVAKFLRRHLRQEQEPPIAALEKAFPGLQPITVEQYDRLTALRMENPKKVTGVFELDFDCQRASNVDVEEGWQTWSMKDVSAAVERAWHKSNLLAEQYEPRFWIALSRRQEISAGHLSAQQIVFSEEISEVDGLLNFYMEVGFDADAVFGMHVCTAENDDWINVYANYDMATGQVCDALEIVLHRGDGVEEELTYPLDAVEKALLLQKMDEYCQQQTGQTLEEFSAQLMEELAPPSGPTM